MSQRAIGAKTYGPLYKDPDLQLDEFCACTKRLWSLTQFNVQKHLAGPRITKSRVLGTKKYRAIV